MKRISLAVLLVCTQWAISLNAAKPSLRIDLNATSAKVILTPEGASEGLKLEHPWWITNDAQRQSWLWLTGPETADKTWHKFEFSFKSSANTVVALHFAWGNSGNHETIQWGAFRRLSATGTCLKNGDFSQGLANWKALPHQLSAKKTPNAFASHPCRLTQQIYVRGGETVTIRGEYRMAERSELPPPPKPKPPVTVEYNGFKLKLDGSSGIWNHVSYHDREIFVNTAQLPPFEFRLDDGQTCIPGRDLFLDRWNFDRNTGTLMLTYASKEYRITETIRLDMDALNRTADIIRIGNAPEKFYSFTFIYPLAVAGSYYFPATFWGDNTDNREINAWPGVAKACSPLPSGSLDKLTTHELTGYFRIWPMMVEYAPNRTLLFMPDFRRDEGHCSLYGGKQTVKATVKYDAQGWAEPGQVQHIDTSRVILATGSPRDVLESRVADEFRRLNLAVPSDRPESVFRARIYEWIVGGGKASKADLGTFKIVENALLDRVAGLGFNTVWQTPAQQNNGVDYTPRDYYKPARGYGSYDDLKALVKSAHARGVKLWLDIVPHGDSPDNSGMIRGNSPWTCVLTEEGNMLSGLAFDYNSPEWQRYMQKVAAFYTGELGADGVRIDYAIGSYYPNWRRAGFPSSDFVPGLVDRWSRNHVYRKVNADWYRKALKTAGGTVPPLGYERASHAQREGAAGMIEAIRHGVKKGRTNGTVLAEGGGPTLIHSADLVHDRQFSHIIYKLPEFSPGEFVKYFAQWLTEQRLAEPPGALWMRIIACHDNNIHGQNLIGLKAMEAYIASAYLVAGVPLPVLYPADRGIGSFLQRLNSLRASVPELDTGIPEYAVARGAPSVLQIRRSGKKNSVVGLINFSGRSAEPELKWSGGPDARDIFNAFPVKRSEQTVKVKLPPWGVALLSGNTDKSFAAAPMKETAVKSTVAPQGQKNGDKLVISTPAYSTEISAKSGLLTHFAPRNGTVFKNMVVLFSQDVKGDAQTSWNRNPDGSLVIDAVLPGGLKLHYVCRGQSLEVTVDPDKLESEKCGLGLMLPDADRYRIFAVDGIFDDFFKAAWSRNRKGARVGTTGSSYRPYNPAIYYNSRQHPLDPAQPVMAFSSGNKAMSCLGFKRCDGNVLPQILLGDQLEDYAGLWVGMFVKPERAVPGKPFRFVLGEKDEPGNADPVQGIRLECDSLNYVISNANYKISLRRTGGVIASIETGGKTVLRNQDIYSAHKTLFHHETMLSHDAQTELTWRRDGERLRLLFRGQLARRRAGQTGLPDPILFETEYIFDRSPTFQVNYRLMTLAALTGPAPGLEFRADPCGPVTFSALQNLAPVKDHPGRFRLFDRNSRPDYSKWQYYSMRITAGQAQPAGLSVAADFPATLPFDPDLSFERRHTWKRYPSGENAFFPLPLFEPGFRFSAGERADIVAGHASDGNYSIQLENIGARYFQLLPGPMKPGKYRISIAVSGNNVRPEQRKGPRPFIMLQLRYATAGNRYEVIKSPKEFVPENFNWRRESLEFKLEQAAFLPEFRFDAALDGGRIYLDDIRIEKID